MYDKVKETYSRKKNSSWSDLKFQNGGHLKSLNKNCGKTVKNKKNY